MRNLTRRLRQRCFALGSKHCSVLPRGKLVRRSKFPYKIPMGSTPRDYPRTPILVSIFYSMVTRTRNLTRRLRQRRFALGSHTPRRARRARS